MVVVKMLPQLVAYMLAECHILMLYVYFSLRSWEVRASITHISVLKEIHIRIRDQD